METSKLTVSLRTDTSKSHLKEMRRQGRVPGSVCGKGVKTLSLEVGIVELAKALKTEAGMHTIMALEINGAEKNASGTAVIKNVQQNPMNRDILHVDFERVQMSDIITSKVPIELVGSAPGLLHGGILEQVLTEAEVKSRADAIPVKLDVYVSGLELGDAIHASDISLPNGIEMVTRPDDVVVTMRPPHVPFEEEEEEETVSVLGG